MLRLEGLSVSYAAGKDSVPATELIDADFPRGAIGAIVGPSGCGKTSLVRVVAGLRRPDSGRVLVEGHELSGTREGTAVIFQDFGLLPWKTVEANVELPLLLKGVGARERRARAAPILAELGLEGFGSFFPSRLSGGMRQRVAVARALVTEPDLLLMDEPFSSLDALTRESMQETLLEAQARRGTTAVLVTHSVEEAVYLADLVYVMAGRNPGRISARIETGTGGEARGPAYRESPRFFELCSALRRELSRAAGRAEAQAAG